MLVTLLVISAVSLIRKMIRELYTVHCNLLNSSVHVHILFNTGNIKTFQMDFEFELDLDSLVEWPKYLILLFSQFNAELA